MPNVWRLIAHHQNPHPTIAWIRGNERIAIGWGRIGDLSQPPPLSAAQISHAIRATYHGIQNAGLGGPSLWNFYHEMRESDLVIVGDGKRRILVVEVRGDYERVPVMPPFIDGYNHQRPVRVTAWTPEVLWRMAGGSPAPGQNRRWTLFRCRDPISPADAANPK